MRKAYLESFQHHGPQVGFSHFIDYSLVVLYIGPKKSGSLS